MLQAGLLIDHVILHQSAENIIVKLDNKTTSILQPLMLSPRDGLIIEVLVSVCPCSLQPNVPQAGSSTYNQPEFTHQVAD